MPDITATEEAAAEAAWQAWRMSQCIMPGDWSVVGYEAKEDWRAAARAVAALERQRIRQLARDDGIPAHVSVPFADLLDGTGA